MIVIALPTLHQETLDEAAFILVNALPAERSAVERVVRDALGASANNLVSQSRGETDGFDDPTVVIEALDRARFGAEIIRPVVFELVR